MLYVISYDIADDNRRRRLFETLKDFGRRVQYSVFECDLDAAALEDLCAKVNVEIDVETDSCRFYRLCGTCSSEVRIFGRGDRYVEPSVIVV